METIKEVGYAAGGFTLYFGSAAVYIYGLVHAAQSEAWLAFVTALVIPPVGVISGITALLGFW